MSNLARFFLVTLLVSVPYVAGADSTRFAECANLLSTGAQKECAEAAFKTSETEMQAAYEAAVERAAKAGTPADPAAKGWAATLRKSQLAWQAYRDAECRGFVGYGEGSGRMVWVLGCHAEKNRERTQELQVPFYQR
jgi:uncharacterized protein YecT (DUF1311 family)